MLHNKVLFADADMAKADWTTTVASIVGVAGVGVGIWWLDGAAALFISIGILWDGIRNTRGATADLMDQRARSYDDKTPHPLAGEIVDYLEGLPWVERAGVRMRDMGQVFHIEAFVVPRRGRVSTDELTDGVEGHRGARLEGAGHLRHPGPVAARRPDHDGRHPERAHGSS